MSTTSQISVVYDGPALTRHEMDVSELAPALLAIGELLEEANMLLNGKATKMQVRVKGSFKTGSFGIDLTVIQSLPDQLLSLIQSNTTVSAATVVTLVGLTAKDAVRGLVQLLRWLRGRTPNKVVILDNERVRVEVDNEHLEVETRVIELFRSYKLRDALERTLKPLDREGIDSFAVTDAPQEKTGFLMIEKSERAYFSTPAIIEDQHEESEFVLNVQAVNVAFQGDNKWRFTDGNSTFHAAIADNEFLSKVANNDLSFTKGDVLRVRMRKHQWMAGEKMRTEYEVLRVLEHRSAARQLPLRIEDERS
jgi:hypothetical protein